MEGSILSINLKKILNPKINLIDIRTVTSYKLEHIPYAKNIGKNELMFNTSKYLKKGLTYYIYCQKGIQSRSLVNYLRNEGYDTISLVGGYENYKKLK
ncbi:MAG: rhodanese-like domain-containing protein [Firmicutes bacterium]|nr:rhodanese-like domain-containing protein [Bacillota bacterium]